MSIAQKNETEELKKEAEAFLDEHKKMILTVLDEEGHPNSSLMLYANDGFDIYFGTCESFGKYKALMKDPHVALAVVQEKIDPLQVLDIQGVVEEVPKGDTQERLDWFVSKNTSKYYIKDAEDFVMFKVKPLCIRWLDATSGDLQVCDIQV